MALKVFEDTFYSQGKQWEGKTEIPIDTEILIPDYLPQVFKVVKCLVYLVVLQKNISGSRLRLEGYLRCVVLYQAEEAGSLCRTEQKIPFERSVDLPDESFSASVVKTDGKVEYINCRAVNQRRMEVRGGYDLSYRMTGAEECKLVTSLADDGVEQQMKSINCMQITANLDKLITTEEELTLPGDLKTIIDVSGAGRVTEKKLLGGKAVLKGYTAVKILFTRQDRSELGMDNVQVSFNQIVDVEGIDENCLCVAEMETIGCAVTAGSDGTSVLTVTSMLHLTAYRQTTIEAVHDAFSTSNKTETAYAPFCCDGSAVSVEDATAAVETMVQLPDRECVSVGCLTSVSNAVADMTDGSAVLSGQLQLSLIYKNTLDEFACVDTAVPYQFDIACNSAEKVTFDGCTMLESVQLRQNEGNVSVNGRISINGLLLMRESCTMLAGIESVGLLEEKSDVALRIYYASEKETVFDIAKKYHAKPKTLMQCNGLEKDVLDEKRHLLIPSAN